MSKGMLRPGDDLIAVGCAGLMGTSELTSLFSDELEAFFPSSFMDRVRTLGREKYADEREAEKILSSCTAFTPVSSGGFLAALWEISERSGTGLEAELERVPIRQETIEICEYFDLNPYRLLCRDVWIAGAARSRCILREFEALGVPCAVFGMVTPGPARMIKGADGWRYLEKPLPDELEKGKGRKDGTFSYRTS